MSQKVDMDHYGWTFSKKNGMVFIKYRPHLRSDLISSIEQVILMNSTKPGIELLFNCMKDHLTKDYFWVIILFFTGNLYSFLCARVWGPWKHRRLTNHSAARTLPLQVLNM